VVISVSRRRDCRIVPESRSRTPSEIFPRFCRCPSVTDSEVKRKRALSHDGSGTEFARERRSSAPRRRGSRTRRGFSGFRSASSAAGPLVRELRERLTGRPRACSMSSTRPVRLLGQPWHLQLVAVDRSGSPRSSCRYDECPVERSVVDVSAPRRRPCSVTPSTSSDRPRPIRFRASFRLRSVAHGLLRILRLGGDRHFGKRSARHDVGDDFSPRASRSPATDAADAEVARNPSNAAEPNARIDPDGIFATKLRARLRPPAPPPAGAAHWSSRRPRPLELSAAPTYCVSARTQGRSARDRRLRRDEPRARRRVRARDRAAPASGVARGSGELRQLSLVMATEIE